MASTTVVKVKVEELTKFGYKANGKYVNYSKNLSESDKALVVPGAEFEAEYYVADSGKEYLNKIVARASHVETPKEAPVIVKPTLKTPEVIAASVSAKNETMTRQDWEAKDRRISRQGVIQAAVKAVSHFVTPEDHFEVARALAEKMLYFINGGK